MGAYVNPGNDGFKEIVSGEYFDKSGIIGIINDRLETNEKLICVSRPRRFGKSYVVDMLSAYYDCTCDSHGLFEKLEIASLDSYEENINKYNVIVLDIAGFISRARREGCAMVELTSLISEALRQELVEYCPEIKHKDSLSDCFIECIKATGRKFVFLIDEWDALIREARDDKEAQRNYLALLREWFKNRNFTPKVVAAAYMTGILPIIKDGSQSAISDFREFTILNPGPFTKYTGFCENEVKILCEKHHMDFDLMKQWYDGYDFEGVGSLYNPYSVMETIKTGDYTSHWQKTSVAENLVTYINMDEEGLQEDVIKLLAKEPVSVNVRGFMNDFETFNTKDDVITLLIHLGYLSYNRNDQSVRIPNMEVELEFKDILAHPAHTKLLSLVRASEKLLKDTLSGNGDEVAKAIEQVRETNYAPQYYNNEQALRYAVKFAYIVCVDRFLKVEELPSGRGLADLVFIPKKNTAYPAIIVELKWNKDVETASDQIEDKRYDAVLRGYSGEIVKAGIIYDTERKVHTCRITKYVT